MGKTNNTVLLIGCGSIMLIMLIIAVDVLVSFIFDEGEILVLILGAIVLLCIVGAIISSSILEREKPKIKNSQSNTPERTIENEGCSNDILVQQDPPKTRYSSSQLNIGSYIPEEHPEYDVLFMDAAILVVDEQMASVSLLNRRMKLGYTRAARIMDQLEDAGIIGQGQGSRNRPVLIKDRLELETRIASAHSSTPKTYMNQQINETLDIADEIVELCRQCSADKSFQEIMANCGKNDVCNEQGEPILGENGKAYHLFISDIAFCIEEMKGDINLKDKDGIAIVYLTTKLITTATGKTAKFDHSEDNIALIHKSMTRTTESLINTLLINGNKELYMPTVLQSYNAGLYIQYLVLLYRFFSLVAKADGIVTSKEQEFLNSIMQLQHNSITVNKVTSSISRKDSSPMSDLDKLIGLESVKKEVQTMANFIKVQLSRQQKGLRTSPISYHCVFTGNPGTGKTTVARILATIYKDLGVIKKGHLVETDRSGLVAEYVGHTAIKTNQIIDSALDGILFIDEAYSLSEGGSGDFGKEAISTLLKRMEDDRDRLVVIIAGYNDEIKQFIDTNPGLQSRFNRYIHFPDYSAAELYQIFCLLAKKYDYELSTDASEKIISQLNYAVEHKDKNFGNGRFVRNFFEKTLERQANRLASIPHPSLADLRLIKAEDCK